MAYADAITVLFEAVRDAGEALDPSLSVVFGAREPHKHVNQGEARAARVVFVPGDDGGKLGTYRSPRRSGGNPRAVFDELALCRVFVWAADRTDPRDELAQYRALRELREWVITTMRATAHGTFKLVGSRRVGEPSDVMFGAELVLDLEIEIPICESARPMAAGASLGSTTTGVLVGPSGDTTVCEHEEPVPE